MAYARCNFDGRPLSPGDAAVAGNFREFLRVRAAELGLRWCEQFKGPYGRGPYWVYWFCEPPVPRALWRTVREEWDISGDGLPVRRIYEIEVADAAQGEGSTERAGPAGPGSEGRPAPARSPGSGPAQGTGRDRGATGPAGAAR